MSGQERGESAERFDEARALLQRARAGDRDACAALLARYTQPILERIRRMMGPEARSAAESGDFLQAALLEVLQESDDDLPEDEEAFLRWVTAIVRNDIRDEVRRIRARSLESVSRLTRHQDSTQTSPPSDCARDERVRRLSAALGRLSEEHRRVLELTDLDGLSLEEVGLRLEKSPDAVRMLRKRALLRLGQLLGEERDA